VPTLPTQFDEFAPYELLRETEAGRIGFDQRLILSLTARPELALSDLVRFAAEVHDDALLDLGEQLFDLLRHFNSPVAIPFYLQQIRHSTDGVPDEIVEAFAALGASALEPLLTAVDGAEDEVRRELVFLLATLGTHDDRIGALFTGLLAEDPYEAALCIGLYGDQSLRPAVESALLAIGNDPERAAEAKALNDCLEQLDSGERALPDSGFDIFKLYPEQALPLFESLPEDQVEEYLACESSEYRAAAAMSLCDEEYNEDTAAALLERANTDEDEGVRAAALRALGFAATRQPEIREFLVEALDREALSVAERAATAIALAENPTGRVHEVIHELYAVPEARAEAVEAMWRTHDIRYCPYISENLTHADAAVRRSAVIAVGAYPMTDLADELVDLFDDEETRGQALFSYALAAPGKTTEKSVQKLFEKIDELAGGLTHGESEAVASALDGRLEREGLEPVFFPEDDESEEGDEEEAGHVHGPDCHHDHEPAAPAVPKVGRNDLCPCGSGKKYKKCHGESN